MYIYIYIMYLGVNKNVKIVYKIKTRQVYLNKSTP